MILQNFFELFSPLNWIRLFWGWVKWKCLLRLILIYAFQNRPNSKGWRTANSKPWNSIRNSQECLKDKIVKKKCTLCTLIVFPGFYVLFIKLPGDWKSATKNQISSIFFCHCLKLKREEAKLSLLFSNCDFIRKNLD